MNLKFTLLWYYVSFGIFSKILPKGNITEWAYSDEWCSFRIFNALNTKINRKEVFWEWETVVSRLRTVLFKHSSMGFFYNYVVISCYFQFEAQLNGEWLSSTWFCITHSWTSFLTFWSFVAIIKLQISFIVYVRKKLCARISAYFEW